MSCQLSFRLSVRAGRHQSIFCVADLGGAIVPSAAAAEPRPSVVVVVVDRRDSLINRVADCRPANYQLTCRVNRPVVRLLLCLLLGYSDICFRP